MRTRLRMQLEKRCDDYVQNALFTITANY